MPEVIPLFNILFFTAKSAWVDTGESKKLTDNIKKVDLSVHVAEVLAKKALEKKITKVYFDRGSYKYHGRIKIFANALRKGGLTF